MHELHYVGQRMQRPDALAKATGAAQYTADLVVHRRDVLHAKALYPPYGHAKILRIDTSKAAALPGVAIVMTADDLPGENGYGGIIHDKPVIAKDEVFYEGDPVALVAAEDLKTAEKAVSLIEVEYEPLESYDSPADMLREDAPVLHREYPIPRKGNISDEVLIRKGDVKTAFEDADVVVDNWYKTPMLDHAYLEPDCALAEPDPVQGGITIYSPQHAVQLAKKALCGAFNMPQSKIRVISQVVGGGFGGKEDSTFDASAMPRRSITGSQRIRRATSSASRSIRSSTRARGNPLMPSRRARRSMRAAFTASTMRSRIRGRCSPTIPMAARSAGSAARRRRSP